MPPEPPETLPFHTACLRHAVRWLLTASLLAALGYGVYVAVRFHHVDNHLYRWWTGRDARAAPRSAEPGLRLDRYRMDGAARPVEGIDRNLSGLAFDAERQRLIAVVNRPATLLLLDLEGRVTGRHRLRNASDVEGVAFLGGGRIALVEEGTRRVLLATLPRDGRDADMDLQSAPSLRLDFGDGAGAAAAPGARRNQGLEGVGYDPARDQLYVVKEHSPRGLYRITGWGRPEPDAPAAFAIEDLSAWLRQSVGATDLSSIEVDPDTGHLLLLSDESQSLVELDRQGARVGALRLDGVPQAEGVALGSDGTVYLVSEPNLFYRLRPGAPRQPAP
ncbi:MAG: SdiA-regulated domain-containing protein [Xylophilus ampelinus]